MADITLVKEDKSVEKMEFLFPTFLSFMKAAFEENVVKEEAMKHWRDRGKHPYEFVANWFIKSKIFLIGEPETAYHPDTNKPLDLPFDYCFFEAPAANYVGHVFDAQLPVWMRTGREEKITLSFLLVSDVNGVLEIIAYGKSNKDPRGGFWAYRSDMGDKNGFLKDLAHLLCDQLKICSIATEKLHVQQKARIYGKNTHHKIKEVIHVLPKKTSTIKRVQEGSTIDWSHRWEVRGHWRKIHGVGKNRQGEYMVKDQTWVLPHEKGPDNKPLVKKIRLHKPDESVSV